MARKAKPLAKPFQGKWRITSMELWDRAAINLVGPGFIEFKGEEGAMAFIVVEAWLDVRYGERDGKPVAEFSWERHRRGRPTFRPRLGHDKQTRNPRRPHLFPPGR